MASNVNQAEGTWEELVRQSSKFAGKRVRVTILPDVADNGHALRTGVRNWLVEGEELEIIPPSTPSNAFTNGVAEKYRKQGLML